MRTHPGRKAVGLCPTPRGLSLWFSKMMRSVYPKWTGRPARCIILQTCDGARVAYLRCPNLRSRESKDNNCRTQWHFRDVTQLGDCQEAGTDQHFSVTHIKETLHHFRGLTRRSASLFSSTRRLRARRLGLPCSAAPAGCGRGARVFPVQQHPYTA